MDKKQTLERDIKSLEVRLRGDRLKRQNLESETTQLFNQKIKLKEDIIGLETAAGSKHKVIKELQKKISGSIQRYKDQEGKTVMQKKDIDQAAIKNKRVLQMIDSKEQRSVEVNESITQEKLRLKEKTKILTSSEVELSKDQTRFDKMVLKLTKDESKLEKARTTIINQLELIEGKQEEADATLAKAAELKTKLDVKISETKEIDTSQKQRELLLDTQTKRLSIVEEGIDLARRKTRERENALQAKEQALSRAYDDLEVQKKEVKVLELRVRKLIRQKAIGKELKALEESLNK